MTPAQHADLLGVLAIALAFSLLAAAGCMVEGWLKRKGWVR